MLDRKIGQEVMDQLFLKSFVLAETMIKSGASFGETTATALSWAPYRERDTRRLTFVN
jgi:hypothetical protein